MADRNHVEWLKEGRKLWNDRRSIVRFSPELSSVDFREILNEIPEKQRKNDFFSRFNFTGANLRGAKFAGLKFERANFQGADLSFSDMSSGYFAGSNFNYAALNAVRAEGSNFRRAKFIETRLEAADLRGADFTDAWTVWPYLTVEQFLSIRDPEELRRGKEGIISGGSSVLSKAPDAQRQPEREPTYLVTYCTNRVPVRQVGSLTFNGERSDTCSYGLCQVVVPKHHKIGSIGSPFWKRLLIGDDRIKIRKTIGLSEHLYWEFIRANFPGTDGETPSTMLVHGYNMDFSASVVWAAQIGFDLGLMRGVHLFSWPSKGSRLSYVADEASVDESKYHLKKYILDFIDRADGSSINIIAHSMGGRCLALALELIGLQDPSKLRSINQIIFAAADIDQRVMRQIGSHVVGNAGRTTSYACKGDLAVLASSIIHEFARVGLMPPIFVFDNVDTIEVKKESIISIGHGYVADAKAILADIHALLRYSAPPWDRFSIERAPNELAGTTASHWVLKE